MTLFAHEVHRVRGRHEEEFEAAFRDGWMAALDSTKAEVFLPKFKLTNDLSLATTLKALGLEIAFDPGLADFARMTPEHVWIDDVRHKSYVDVNEEGTEAAAATSVDMVDSAGLGEIVRTYTTVSRQGGNLKLLSLTKRITDLLAITKLLTVFETFSDSSSVSFAATATDCRKRQSSPFENVPVNRASSVMVAVSDNFQRYDAPVP